jgi:hypothetical protein
MPNYWTYDDYLKASKKSGRVLVCLATIAASGGFAADKVDGTLKRLKEIENKGRGEGKEMKNNDMRNFIIFLFVFAAVLAAAGVPLVIFFRENLLVLGGLFCAFAICCAGAGLQTFILNRFFWKT